MLKTLLLYEEELYAIGVKALLEIIDNTIQVISKNIHEDIDNTLLQDRFDYAIIIHNNNDIEQLLTKLKDYNHFTKLFIILDKPNSNLIPLIKKYNIVSLIHKKLPATKITSIFRQNFEGESYYPSDIFLDDRPPLTKHQIMILKGIGQGLSNKQIAFELNISETTVKTHTTNIMKKLKCYNRVAAFRKALDLGIID